MATAVQISEAAKSLARKHENPEIQTLGGIVQRLAENVDERLLAHFDNDRDLHHLITILSDRVTALERSLAKLQPKASPLADTAPHRPRDCADFRV